MTTKQKADLEEFAVQCKDNCHSCPKISILGADYPNVCAVRRARFLLGESVGNKELRDDYQRVVMGKEEPWK